MRNRFIMGPLIALLSFTASALAQSYVEDFSGGSSAVQSTLSLGTGSWTYTGAVARVKFSATTPYAVPDTAVLRPLANAFTGNYIRSGVELLGFRFRSGAPRPSALYVELSGKDSVYQASLPVPPEGEWQAYMVSLPHAGSGVWKLKSGTEENFSKVLEAVRSLEIKIRRAGALAVEYALDDLYVDGLPRSGGGAFAMGQDMSLPWDFLQPGNRYMVQKSYSLAGPWVDDHAFLSTNRFQRVDIPHDLSLTQAFYRLRGP